jgi:hypothetical protein
MIFFSILFLGDKHLFHKLCSIFLFVGGMIVLIMELISPEKKKVKNTMNQMILMIIKMRKKMKIMKIVGMTPIPQQN